MTLIDWPLIVLSAVSFVWLVLSILMALENHRYSLRRLAKRCGIRIREHRTMLVVPVKGGEHSVSENLAGFFRQRHPNFELVLVVESADDPAVPEIEQLQRQMPRVDCRLVIAGVADRHGQKVHNLLAATGQMDPAVLVVAFADADIQPEPDWLHTLCHTVCKQKNRAANTGYRWMLPDRYSLANLLLYSVNTTLAGTMGAGTHHLIWGGSWAMRRSSFDQLAIRANWEGTLSDDLVATRTLRRLGQLIVYDPRCLCKTRFDSTLPQAMEFLRRQFLIGRKYAPRLYLAGLGLVFANVVSWWWLVWLSTRTGTIARLAMIWVVTVYTASVIKGILRQTILATRDSITFRRYLPAAVFDILCWPLVSTFTLFLMFSATVGNTIRWSGNHYLIRRGGQIRLLPGSGPGTSNEHEKGTLMDEHNSRHAA